MKPAILDTDTISYFFRGDENVAKNLDLYLNEHEFVFISAITYYEVLNGLYFKDAKRQLKQFDAFTSLNRIVPLDQRIASRSALIYSELRTKGQLIGHNDVLIAGTAIECELILVTNNIRHFSRIPDIELINWSAKP